MRRHSFPVLVILSVTFLLSCKRQLVEQPAEQVVVPAGELKQTKIGELKPNVFSHAVVQKALNGLLSAKPGISGNSIGQQAVISPTHFYVRFAPQNEEQLLRLEEADIVLYDVPLNADIVTEGDWYQDPAIPADQITYQYSLIPEGYPLPTDIPYEILDVIFLYNEDSGEELEPDPWSGGGMCEQVDITKGEIIYPPGCIEAPSISAGPQTQSGGKLMPMRQFYSRKKDPVISATNAIKELGIKPADLYAAVARQLQFDPEGGELSLGQNGSSVRYYPKGTLTVHNTELNIGVPLRGVEVRSRNFFKLGRAYTLPDGSFSIYKGYKKRAQLKALTRNPIASVRSIHTWMQPWLSVLTVQQNLGSYNTTDLERIAYNFVYTDNSGTHVSRKWAAFTAISTLTDAYWWNGRDDYEYNFPYVKLLLTDAPTEPGITPMSSYLIKQQTGATELAAAFDLLKDVLKNSVKKQIDHPLMGSALKTVLTAILPDMVYAFGGPDGLTTLTSRQLQNGVFRSAGRATHYYSLFKKISPTSSATSNYWWTVQKRMLAHRVNNNNWPFGQRTDANAEQIALIEAWAYYYGNIRNSERHRTGLFNNNNGFAISASELTQLENQRLRTDISLAAFGTGISTWYEGWIPCGILYDLGDSGENTSFTNITDGANVYSTIRLYKALITDAHQTISGFVTTLLNQQVYIQETEVRSLQLQYGF